MTHDEAAELLGPYRDGELDLASCLKLEEHLTGCPSCQHKLAEEQEVVDFIQSEAPRFKASPFLKTRVQAALRAERPSSVGLPWWKHLLPASTLSTVAGIVVVLVVLVVLALGLFQSRETPALDQEAIANHVRSLQANHLMDVASTDQHTVKPWFAGKLDYSPQVVDLTSSGYPLIGGRLDVLDHRDVAAIIYGRRKHFINLFIWPAVTGSLSGRMYEQNGYHAVGWTKSGMNYLAVSELGRNELLEFEQMIQNQTVDTRQGE